MARHNPWGWLWAVAGVVNVFLLGRAWKVREMPPIRMSNGGTTFRSDLRDKTALGIMGITMIVLPLTNMLRRPTTVSVWLPFGLVACLWLLASVSLVRWGLSALPTVVVGPGGITVHTTSRSVHLDWDEIARVTLIQRSRSAALCIFAEDPDDVLSRCSLIQRLVGRHSSRRGDATLFVDLSLFGDLSVRSALEGELGSALDTWSGGRFEGGVSV